MFDGALSVVFNGSGFGLAWWLAGTPHTWLATVYSTFGRFLTRVGLGLIFLSPDATREGIQPPKWWVVVLGLVSIAVFAFTLGIQFGASETADLWAPAIIKKG